MYDVQSDSYDYALVRVSPSEWQGDRARKQ